MKSAYVDAEFAPLPLIDSHPFVTFPQETFQLEKKVCFFLTLRRQLFVFTPFIDGADLQLYLKNDKFSEEASKFISAVLDYLHSKSVCASCHKSPNVLINSLGFPVINID